MKKLAMVISVMTASVFSTTACSAQDIINAQAQASANVRFSDISAHWAKDSILKAVQAGYVDGYPDGTFQPDQTVSRAEFIKMVTTALKLDITPQDGADWYVPYINAAAAAEIHKWGDFTTGDWNTPITRQEMSRIAVRAADSKNTDSTDAAYMYDATKKGIIQGLSGGELGKDQPTTRGQSVTIIDRILTVKNGGKLPVDQDAASYAEVEYHGTNVETIFEQYGLKAVDFPVSLDLASNVTTTIDKMIIVDMDRKDGAYRSWFNDAKKTNDKPIQNEYLVAFHVNMSNTVADPQGGYVNFRSKVFPMIGGLPAIFNKSNSTIKIIPALFLRTANSIDGWYLQTVSKSVFERDKGKSVIRLTNGLDNKEIWFNQQAN